MASTVWDYVSGCFVTGTKETHVLLILGADIGFVRLLASGSGGNKRESFQHIWTSQNCMICLETMKKIERVSTAGCDALLLLRVFGAVLDNWALKLQAWTYLNSYDFN